MPVHFPDALWRKAFERAWESYRAGGYGVGALALDAEGRLLTAARNRGGDTTAAPLGQLGGTPLGHAELNALGALGAEAPQGLVVRTTLQPCALCTAAMAMRRVQRVEFAGVDPLWHGLSAAHRAHPFLAERWAQQTGPLDGAPAVLAEVLTLSRYLTLPRRGSSTIATYRQANPSVLALAERLAAAEPDVVRLSFDDFLDRWGERLEAATPTRPRPHVRRLTADDWRVFREIRLASLADAPDAFGSSLDLERGMDEAAWRERVATSVRLLACVVDRPVGTISVRAHAERAGEGMITAMWVVPSARGQGLGDRLVDAAVDAWRGVGGAAIGMTCVESNRQAMDLYRRKGFQATGRSWPMAGGRLEVELVRPL